MKRPSQRRAPERPLRPLEKATVEIDAKSEEKAKKRAVEKLQQRDWTVRKVERRSWF